MNRRHSPLARWRGFEYAALLLVSLGYLLLAWRNYHFQLDDGLIYLRYVRNFLDGHGLVYNVGSSFDALTSPTFSYLLLITAWLLHNPQAAAWLISMLGTLGGAIVMYLNFRDELAPEGRLLQCAMLFGLLLTLILPYFFTTYGMETGLFFLAVAACLRAYLKQRWALFLIMCMLVVTIRAEGVFLCAACGMHYLWTQKRFVPLPVAGMLGAAAVLALIVIANMAFFGTLWPSTGMAKIQQGQSGLWGQGWLFLHAGFLRDFAFAGSIASMIAISVAGLTGAIVLRGHRLTFITAAFLVMYLAFYTLLRIPAYHWYYSAFFMFLPFFAAAGIGGLLGAIPARKRVWPRIVAVLVLAIACAPALWHFARTDLIPKSGFRPYIQIGQWIEANTPENASVAMVEIGTVGWYAHRHIIDILGLVSPGNAERIGHRDFDGWLDDYRPDYLLVHEPVWDHEISFFTMLKRYKLTQQCGMHVAGYAIYRIDYHPDADIFCSTKEAQSRVSTVNARASIPIDTGAIDMATPVGAFVRVHGWASDGAGGNFSQLAVAPTPGMAFGWYRHMPRSDVASHFYNRSYLQSGYDLVLRFGDVAEARAWSKHPCVYSQRRDGSWFALAHSTGCEAMSAPKAVHDHN